MNRDNLIKLAIFCGVVVLLGIFITSRESGTDLIAEDLAEALPGFRDQLENVQSLTVRTETGEVLVRAERSESGWRVANREGYPADPKRVRDLLTSLAEARLQEAKTTNPEWYARLGVQDVPDAVVQKAPEAEEDSDPHAFMKEDKEDKEGPRLVSVTLADGSEKALIIGKRAEGWKAHYARVPGDAQSWVLDREIDISMKTLPWMEAKVIDVDLERVSAVSHVAPDGEKLLISKQKPGQEHFDVAGIPEGRELRYPAIPEVVADVIDNLRMEDVQAASKFIFPADSVYEAVFETFDGLRVHAKAAEVGGEHFVAMTASFDPEIRFTEPEAVSGEGAPETGVSEGLQSEPADAKPALKSPEEVQAEVEALREHLGNWVFQVAEYRYRGFTKRLSELLKEESTGRGESRFSRRGQHCRQFLSL